MTPLEQAARAAQHAPPVFNSQPWNWRLADDVLELFADPQRRAGAAHDHGAAYVVLFGPGDEPIDLLQGGEALSALLLATADGPATAPLSGAVEGDPL